MHTYTPEYDARNNEQLRTRCSIWFSSAISCLLKYYTVGFHPKTGISGSFCAKNRYELKPCGQHMLGGLRLGSLAPYYFWRETGLVHLDLSTLSGFHLFLPVIVNQSSAIHCSPIPRMYTKSTTFASFVSFCGWRLTLATWPHHHPPHRHTHKTHTFARVHHHKTQNAVRLPHLTSRWAHQQVEIGLVSRDPWSLA